MKATIISVFMAGALVVVALIASKGSATDEQIVAGGNVYIENGVQIIEIRAKGGYSPMKSVAKAGVPTILRFNTAGTFDCSASVRIPSLSVAKILSGSGETDISIGTSTLGTLNGMCSMGMYPFGVEFKG